MTTNTPNEFVNDNQPEFDETHQIFHSTVGFATNHIQAAGIKVDVLTVLIPTIKSVPIIIDPGEVGVTVGVGVYRGIVQLEVHPADFDAANRHAVHIARTVTAEVMLGRTIAGSVIDGFTVVTDHHDHER
jgi:hypothetical protein